MGGLRGVGSVAALVLGLGGAAAAVPAAAQASDARYALAGSCQALRAPDGRYVVRTADGGYAATATDVARAEPLRLQATALGRYLLYDRSREMPAAGAAGDPSVRATSTPGPAADLTVDDPTTPGSFAITKGGRGLATDPDGRLVLAATPATFAFVPATGCADFPEAETDATGTPATGPTPYGTTTGFVDAHMHMMGFEFLGGQAHCGRPWSPYGITVALSGCETGAAGDRLTTALEVALGGGSPTDDPVGWPTFKSWPAYDRLAHEASYYVWLKRAWLGGLRVFVNLFVENHALCEVWPEKKNSCNEMDSVRLQSADLRALQDYVDAQEGGPGKGWFRIVSDPFQARRVINAGKLAVVPGIEVSQLFDCGVRDDVAQCTDGEVDQRLDAVYRDLGVRDMELINKFDNGFGGVAGDTGSTGLVVNAGNKLETGRYWQMQTCTGPPEEHDREQATLDAAGRTKLAAGLAALLPSTAALPIASVPLYPPAPHCNARGLTEQGAHLVRRMIAKGMIIDPDHLDVLSRKALLDIVESERYSGIVSSHSWSTADAYPRIYRLGGMVTPYAGDSTTFVQAWKQVKAADRSPYPFAIGYGADMNGFGHQGAPRDGAGGAGPVAYPFKSADGRVTFERQRTGSRVFDVNTDGVAHYGLYPDWIEDLRKLAGPQIVTDLQHGSEAYLDMWERAVGIAAPACRSARLRFTAAGLGLFRLRATAEEQLRGAGQPADRTGRTWTSCVRGRAPAGRVREVFTPAGRAALIASTAPRHRVAGVGRGSRASRLQGVRAFGPGVRVRDAGRGRRYVFGVRAGRVRWAGVATASAARTPAALRRALRLAHLR